MQRITLRRPVVAVLTMLILICAGTLVPRAALADHPPTIIYHGGTRGGHIIVDYGCHEIYPEVTLCIKFENTLVENSTPSGNEIDLSGGRVWITVTDVDGTVTQWNRKGQDRWMIRHGTIQIYFDQSFGTIIDDSTDVVCREQRMSNTVNYERRFLHIKYWCR